MAPNLRLLLHVFLVAGLAAGVSMTQRETLLQPSLAAAPGDAEAAARRAMALQQLHAAIAVRPSDAARVDIGSMTHAAGASFGTTVDPVNFPQDAWRGCPGATREGVQGKPGGVRNTLAVLKDDNVWRRDEAPVVLERVGKVCLARGRPSLDEPVLSWIETLPPPACYSDEEKAKAQAKPPFVPNVTYGGFPGLLKYTVFWPVGGCDRKPCPLLFHLHGLSDHATTWGYPQLMTSNESTCRERLGAILVAPDIDVVSEWFIDQTSAASVLLAKKTILPFVEAFLRDHANQVDAGRVYITGLSNGGELAFNAALLRPDIFSFVVSIDAPLSAGANFAIDAVLAWRNLTAPQRLKEIVFASGSKDEQEVVSFLDKVGTLENAASLSKKVTVHVRVYSGVGHGTWDAVWLQWPDLYDIMFTMAKPLSRPPAPWTAWAVELAVLLVLAVAHRSYVRRSEAVRRAAARAPAAAALEGAARGKADAMAAPAAAASSSSQAAPAAGMKRSPEAPSASSTGPSKPARSKHQATIAWRADPEESHTLHGIFEEAAAKFPKEICVKTVGHQGMTFEQVARAASRCAAHVATLDEEIVGMVAARSYEMIIMILAVLKAGKAYCPVEPDYPPARAELFLQGGRVQHALVPFGQHPQPALAGNQDVDVLLVKSSGDVLTLEGKAIAQDPSRVPKSVPDDAAAYVLFTSGSTGKPKGVHVPHRGSAIYSKYMGHMVQLEGNRTHAMKVPYVFDPSVRDIFMCMLAGRTLALMPPGAHADVRELVDFLVRERVGYSNFSPALLVEFINYLRERPADTREVAANLRFATCGGEALMEATAVELHDLLPEVQLFNVYGPTECSIDTSHFAARPPFEISTTVVPIGWPTPHVVYKVFDPDRYEGQDVVESSLVPVPDGTPGELFIGGDCLALGYIGDPEKTSAVFFNFPQVLPRPPHAASPFSMYKTGDLVKMRASDGSCEFLGRTDFQVKVHGVRIECEEVASVIKRHPKVNDVFVTKFDLPNDAVLVAYVVPATGASDWMPRSAAAQDAKASKEGAGKEEDTDWEAQKACNDALSEWVEQSQLLPVMRPAVYIPLRALPLTTTAKVDRKALPSPAAYLEANEGAEVVDSLGRIRQIRTDAESCYQRLMQTILGLNCIGIVLCHWLPTDATWVMPEVSPFTLRSIQFLQLASNFDFICLFLLLGYRTRRQSLADSRDDMLALALMVVLIGWPDYFSQTAGISTFHRYTCLTLLASHLSLAFCRRFDVPRVLQFAVLFVLTMVFGAHEVYTGMPEDARSVWRYPALIILEPHPYGSWGLQFNCVLLFFLAYHAAPTLEATVRRFADFVGPKAFATLRPLTAVFALAAFVGLVFCINATETISSTSNDAYTTWDVMSTYAYRPSAYPINLLRWLATLACLLMASDLGGWPLHIVGRNFVGVYLVHMYASLDLISMVRSLNQYGWAAELVAVIGVPVLYSLSIGAIAQEVIALAFRGCLALQSRWLAWRAPVK